MKKSGISISLLCLFAAVLLFSSPVRAQSTYGSVVGTVTDPSGAAVAGAQVTLTNAGTGERRTQPSGPDGLYSFVNLFPGKYKIEVILMDDSGAQKDQKSASFTVS